MADQLPDGWWALTIGLAEISERLGCDRTTICDLVRFEELPCYLLLRNTRAETDVRSSRLVAHYLSGFHRLEIESAVDLISGKTEAQLNSWRESFERRRLLSSRCMAEGLSPEDLYQMTRFPMHPTVWIRIGDIPGRLDFVPKLDQLRFMVSDVDRLAALHRNQPSETSPERPERKKTDMQILRERVEAKAARIQSQRSQRLERRDLIKSDEIVTLINESHASVDKRTLKKWVSAYCPAGRPGRPRKMAPVLTK